MLTHSAVGAYLLERALVGAQAVVEGDLLVLDAARRNSNFVVISERGPSYLLKQGVGPDRSASVDHEAAVYRFLRSGGGGNRFLRYLPECHLHDPAEHLLVLELRKGAETLREY